LAMRIGPGETANRHYDSNRYPRRAAMPKSDRLLDEIMSAGRCKVTHCFLMSCV
jgi:hypothetical protein